MTTERRSFPHAPTQPNAVVLTAHPKPDSFSRALAAAWAQGAQGLNVQTFDVAQLAFDPQLHVAYRGDQPLEPDLIRVRDAIEQAAHLVVAFPVWWGSTPAVLKGLFDRLFLPGWAFKYVDHKPVSGLGGRSGRLLVTMDAPVWYDTLVYGAAARRQVGRATLRFSGLSPVRNTAFGSIGTSTDAQRASMLDKARTVGARDARDVLRRLQVRIPQLAAAENLAP